MLTSHFNKHNLLLYHGSYAVIEGIDLEMGKTNKDFGKGFYTTTSKIQAKRFAKQIVRKYNRLVGFVSCYSANNLLEGLNCLYFNSANIDWLDFVVLNRTSAFRNHNYDVVIGPVADDDTSVVIQAYIAGVYGDINSYRVKDYVINLLETGNLVNQVFFGTDKACAKLTFLGGVKV